MNTRLLLCATAAALVLAAGPTDATAEPGGHSDCQAQLTPAVLPHTPDAIQGWFQDCHERHGGLRPIDKSDCHEQLVPAVLPHTADAIEGWSRDCYMHQGRLQTIGPADGGRGVDDGQASNRGGVVPDRMPTDPPANWRRLLDDVGPEPGMDDRPVNWRRLMDDVDTPLRRASSRDTELSQSTDDGWPDYAQLALGGLAGATIVAAVSRTLRARRWRQPPLEAALAAGDPDELPRAAGLLGDLFAQQHRSGAAEHAYRAAIDVGNQYWSPVAQVALAQLLSDLGERAEAQALLKAAIASGHPRAVPAAQASLGELLTGNSPKDPAGHLPEAYETLGDTTPAHR